ncbi:hypothetical protein CYMTET_23863 [Cymbomonas tetramitiformis]|uniref:Uncharacterized protein n=1 Tax=Cymbomonas tetramitiformis TaxID=36881 RepID=A0AAE0FYF8_9CHLO|nr:hypothetical protein CYMTET_23863 [Cymbomonas tetramitiformis]|eukprot:gene23080-27929_t
MKKWTPPQDVDRIQALGPDCPSQLERILLECFQPLPKPKAGDWLAKGAPGDQNGDRRGQTLTQFCRPGPHRNFPSKHCNTIYLVPVGAVDGAPPVEVLAECLHAHFGLEVKTAKPLTKKEMADVNFHQDNAGFGPQLETSTVHDVLSKCRKPRDAWATVGYTMYDLCNTASGFGFVFGEARSDKCTGIFSFARYMETGISQSQFLRRCCMVLAHEVTHLFGIKHCVFARCLMNGSNHLEESESRPFAVCPVDLRKILDSLKPTGGLCPEQRELNLLAFFVKHGLDEDAALSRARLLVMGVQAPVVEFQKCSLLSLENTDSEVEQRNEAEAVGSTQ